MKGFLFISALMLLLFFGCNSRKDFEIIDFNALSNFEYKNDTLILPFDLSNAVIQGISIPTKKQCKEGYFKFCFRIINNSNKSKVVYYKIFYQNESYKFNEFNSFMFRQTYNTLSGNNFYGSWENPSDTFHKTLPIPPDNNFHYVIDSFRITGNPRNEKKYYGSAVQSPKVSDEHISAIINSILNSPEWYKSIQEKAAKSNVTIDDQLYRDAIWMIKENSQKGNDINRWKRNPRVGTYSFLLLAGTEDNLERIPETIKNISNCENDIFINPYYTLLFEKKFLNENGEKLAIVKSKKTLKTYANLDLNSGIYVDLLKCTKRGIDKSFFNSNCGYSEQLYSKAQFEQLFDYIDQNYKLKNIPLAYDVVNDNYSQEDYNKNKTHYNNSELINDFVKTTDCPCKTVSFDTSTGYLSIANPANKNNRFRKENVRVNSRIGFTYGKFIAKIKFPAIINKYNVWNGITCAFWLKFQDDNEWNNRAICDSCGYIPKSEVGETNVRVKTTSYSEIDFEILKTSAFWPRTSYKSSTNFPTDNPQSNNDIIVTCTNWDLACRTPKNFSIGATDFIYNNNKYVVHRWDDWYKALTIKCPVKHDSIFAQPYYFEIDWEPERITWKIGKTKNNMKIIGYMNNTITSIPDNQMVVVISQEFHDSSWWPLSPFMQDYIPFPKNDISGQIFGVEIE
jgi:hypothetical protein